MIKKIKNKKAQMQISFNLIFSILLIIFFIAFGFFGIKKFIEIQERITSEKLIADINDEIDELIQSYSVSQEKTFEVPKKVEQVCFEQQPENSQEPNVYSIPKEIIDGIVGEINWVETNPSGEVLCIDVDSNNRKVSIRFEKNYGEDLIIIKKAGEFVSEEIEEVESNYGEGSINENSNLPYIPSEDSIDDFSCNDVDSSKFEIAFCEDFEDFFLGQYTDEMLRSGNDWDLSLGGSWAHDFVSIRQDSSDNINPSKVMRFIYPKNTHSWYGGGHWWQDLPDGYNELYYSYNVKFKPGFWWVLGGKLHGIAGLPYCDGVGTDDGFGCGPNEGFSSLVMFWSDGRLVSYFGHHNQNQDASGSGKWNAYLHSGEWHTLTMRVVLNDVGYKNGLIEGYLDGRLVFQKNDLEFREKDSIDIDVVRVATFFGGDTDDWNTVREEWTELDNMVVYAYKSEIDVPRGTSKSSSNRILELPNLIYTSENLAPNTRFTVRAKGTQSSGEYAKFIVLVNNNYVGEAETSSDFQDFEFETDFLPSEIDFITIHHFNSAGSSSAGWRTFTLDSIEFQGETYSWNDNNVVYDSGYIDLKNIYATQQPMTWNGAYIFFFDDEVKSELLS